MRNQKRPRRRWLWGLLALSLIALVAAPFFVRPFSKEPEVTAQPEAEPGAPPPAERPRQPRGVTTFLMLGADQRPGDIGRADTLIVGSYDDRTERLAMLSIPRDTYTYVQGYDYTKINHAFAYGGTALTRKSVQELLGLSIDHYVLINFQGFMRFIDGLGGLEIDAEKRMYYVDPEDTGMGPNGLVIDIQPGLQRMDGYTTLAYARFRKDEEADRGRMRRQQQVVGAVVKELVQPATFAKLPKLIPALFGTVQTDLTMAQLISYGLNGREAMAGGVTAASINGEDMMLDGIYYEVPNLLEVRRLAYQTLMGEEPPEPFLAQAEEEQARYARVVREAAARERSEPKPYSAAPAAPVLTEPPLIPRSEPAVTPRSGRAIRPRRGARKARRPLLPN